MAGLHTELGKYLPWAGMATQSTSEDIFGEIEQIAEWGAQQLG